VADASDLSGLELFAGLDDGELAQLADSFEVRTVSPGVELVSEGASGYSFYVLLEGCADVTADGGAVATCRPGDFFGEIAILGDSRRTATVKTTEPSRVLVMFGTEFRRLQESQPGIAARLEDAMRKRIAA
jgi:CRP-like cAMP-binding protein